MRGRALVRHLTVLLLVPAMMIVLAPAAFAQPPNDELVDATVVGALPFTDTLDSADATTAPDDPQPGCVEANNTVWYSYTATENQFIEADTFGSDYDTTLSVWIGEPGALEEIACNDDRGDGVQSRVNVEVTPGTTYYFMVGSFSPEDSGTLVFNVDVGAPPAGLREITLDETMSVDAKTGDVTVTGTVTCTGEDTVFIDGEIRQRKGRVFIEGFYFTQVECTAGTTTWSAQVEFSNGLFTGGAAEVTVFAFSESDDVFVMDSATVRLRGGGGRR